MTCKYNVDEFKQFVSNKIRIKPAPANDWQLINQSLNRCESVGLYSKQLDMTIYDIEFRPFIEFLKREEVTMIGDAIQGSFVIGSSRVLRKESDYEETMGLKDERLQEFISKRDLKIGHYYETLCGEDAQYLGKRYVMNIKTCGYYYRNFQLSKLTLAHFAYIDKQVVNITSRKMVKEGSRALKIDEAEAILQKFYDDDLAWIIFAKKKPINPMIGLVPTTKSVDEILTETRYERRMRFYEKNGDVYISQYGDILTGYLRSFEIKDGVIIISDKTVSAGSVLKTVGSRWSRSMPVNTFDESTLLPVRFGLINTSH